MYSEYDLKLLSNWKPLEEKDISYIQQSLLFIKNSNIQLTSLASCPSTVVNNVSKNIILTPSGGTPPYTTLELLEDGIVVKTLTGSFMTPQTVSYSFPNLGTHTYSSRVTDSCSPPQIGVDSSPCQITVESPQVIPKYKCSNGQCIRDDVGGTYTEPTCGGVCSSIVTDCLNCDLIKNYCIMGQCIPKDYAMYGAIAIAALIVLK